MTHEPTGVAALADRPVDGRRVALVMAAIGVVIALACLAIVEQLLASANDEPAASATLRRAADPPSATTSAPRSAAVVLVDGLRADEARRLPSWRRLARGSFTGVIALPLPTLSRPFQHLLFTGVPPDGSGVRSNRFVSRARHDSIADRVRAAGGTVVIVTDGLDWIPRMIGRPGELGSSAPGATDAPLDGWIERWRASPRPSLLVVHAVGTDASAHAEGIHGPHHRAELVRADGVVARVAAVPDAALFVLSDHGHLERGGHGGPEPEVARAPILIRGARSASREPVDPVRIAATIAAALGVAAPRSALGAALDEREGPSHAARREIVRRGRQADLSRLRAHEPFALAFALFAIVMALGPIKRAFGFDRSVLVAIVAWPCVAVGLHAALGLPLSLSAIDGKATHTLRIAAIGAVAAIVALLAARAASTRGDAAEKLRRAAASVGWSAWASALFAAAQIGFALGPWPLDARDTYLPLFAAGAAAAAILTMSAALLASGLRRA